MSVRISPLLRWQRLDELETNDEQFVVEGLVHATSTILFGRPQSGKGWLAQSMAWAVQNSPTWFGKPVIAKEVAFWPLDPGQRSELKKRARGLEGTSPWIPDERPDSPTFDDFADDLKITNTGLLIVDNLLQLMPDHATINDDGQIRAVLRKLDRIIDKGIAVVLIHHTGKAGEYGTPKTPIGSTAIEAWSRHSLRVEQDKSGLVTINAYGNNLSPFAIQTRIDPSARGDTPFFADPREVKAHERDASRIDDGGIVARHMAQVGSFETIADAAKYLVQTPPEGVAPRNDTAWRTYISRKVLGLGLYVKQGGRRIEPNLELLQ